MQEVIVDARRRQWPKEVKRRIVAETFEPDVTVSEVALRHNIPSSQLFQWRKVFRDEVRQAQAVSFLPVNVEPPEPPPVPGDRIEVVLRNGRRLTVPVSFDAKRLGRVANILDGL